MPKRKLPNITHADIQNAVSEYKKLKFFRISAEMKQLSQFSKLHNNESLTGYELYYLLRILVSIDKNKCPKSFMAIASIIEKFHANDIQAVRMHLQESPHFLENSFGTVLEEAAENALNVASVYSLLSQFSQYIDTLFKKDLVKCKEARRYIVNCIVEVPKCSEFAEQFMMRFSQLSDPEKIKNNAELMIPFLKSLFPHTLIEDKQDHYQFSQDLYDYSNSPVREFKR